MGNASDGSGSHHSAQGVGRASEFAARVIQPERAAHATPPAPPSPATRPRICIAIPPARGGGLGGSGSGANPGRPARLHARPTAPVGRPVGGHDAGLVRWSPVSRWSHGAAVYGVGSSECERIGGPICGLHRAAQVCSPRTVPTDPSTVPVDVVVEARDVWPTGTLRRHPGSSQSSSPPHRPGILPSRPSRRPLVTHSTPMRPSRLLARGATAAARRCPRSPARRRSQSTRQPRGPNSEPRKPSYMPRRLRLARSGGKRDSARPTTRHRTLASPRRGAVRIDCARRRLLRDAHLRGDGEASAARIANRRHWGRKARVGPREERRHGHVAAGNGHARLVRGENHGRLVRPALVVPRAARAREPGAAVGINGARRLPLRNARASRRARRPSIGCGRAPRAHVEEAAGPRAAVGVALARERQAGSRGPSVGSRSRTARSRTRGDSRWPPRTPVRGLLGGRGPSRTARRTRESSRRRSVSAWHGLRSSDSL